MVDKQAVDAKAKIDRQVALSAQKSDTHCLYGYKLLKQEKSKDQNDSKVKKNHTSAANINSKNNDLFNQASG